MITKDSIVSILKTGLLLLCFAGILLGIVTGFNIVRTIAAKSWLESHENCKFLADRNRETSIDSCKNVKTCIDTAEILFIIDSRECKKMLEKSEEIMDLK